MAQVYGRVNRQPLRVRAIAFGKSGRF